MGESIQLGVARQIGGGERSSSSCADAGIDTGLLMTRFGVKYVGATKAGRGENDARATVRRKVDGR
eukprot:84538-Pleurochrysis_carterae.AAC.1